MIYFMLKTDTNTMQHKHISTGVSVFVTTSPEERIGTDKDSRRGYEIFVKKGMHIWYLYLKRIFNILKGKTFSKEVRRK